MTDEVPTIKILIFESGHLSRNELSRSLGSDFEITSIHTSAVAVILLGLAQASEVAGIRRAFPDVGIAVLAGESDAPSVTDTVQMLDSGADACLRFTDRRGLGAHLRAIVRRRSFDAQAAPAFKGLGASAHARRPYD